MSGEEEHLSREEVVEREHQTRLREREEWQKRLEEICREAAARQRRLEGLCATVPIPCLRITA